jgi:hypothetical protein
MVTATISKNVIRSMANGELADDVPGEEGAKPAEHFELELKHGDGPSGVLPYVALRYHQIRPRLDVQSANLEKAQ